MKINKKEKQILLVALRQFKKNTMKWQGEAIKKNLRFWAEYHENNLKGIEAFEKKLNESPPGAGE